MSEWRYDEDRGQWQVPIEDGCIWHPNYVNHRRGRNWIATVNKNLKAPGGLERSFWRKASGRHYMVPDGLTIGNYIELVAITTPLLEGRTGKGNITKLRKFGARPFGLNPLQRRMWGKRRLNQMLP
jgi:hypothetical protein